jgi:putative phosphoesterase
MKIGILSDLHSNAPATHQVLSKLTLEGFDRFLCAGDIVGYYPFPNETIEILKSHSIESVVGNHDVAVLTGETEKFSIDATRAIDWTRRHITNDSLEYLDQKSKILQTTIDGTEIAVVHGSPQYELWEYVYPEEITPRKIKGWFDSPPDILVLGHTHVPFEREVNGVHVVNPGSVGQPRDGDNRASFATLETEQLEIQFHRTPYNIEKTAEKTKEYLPRSLADRLYSGE